MGVIFEHHGYVLSDLAMADAKEIFERLTSNPTVTKYLPYVAHRYLEQTETMIAQYLQLHEQGTHIAVIRHKSASRVVGLMTASRHQHAVALALKIAPDRFSMGAGCIVAPRFVHWLLAHDGIKRVWAYTDIDNKKVANLLSKMGARCEGLMRKYAVHPNISPEPRDCLLWSVVK